MHINTLYSSQILLVTFLFTLLVVMGSMMLSNGSWIGLVVEEYRSKMIMESSQSSCLLYDAGSNRNSLEYVQVVYALLRAHPESATRLLA
jgi:hypothetical protein